MSAGKQNKNVNKGKIVPPFPIVYTDGVLCTDNILEETPLKLIFPAVFESSTYMVHVKYGNAFLKRVEATVHS